MSDKLQYKLNMIYSELEMYDDEDVIDAIFKIKELRKLRENIQYLNDKNDELSEKCNRLSIESANLRKDLCITKAENVALKEDKV